MNRTGIVKAIKGDEVIIELVRHSACGDCGMCGHSHESKCVEVKATNNIGATVGEEVMVEMPDQNLVKVAMVVYTVPLIALIVGVMLGNLMITQMQGQEKELMSFAVGAVFMAGTFFWVKHYDKKAAHKYQVKISRML